jgi:hypothetical protein
VGSAVRLKFGSVVEAVWVPVTWMSASSVKLGGASGTRKNPLGAVKANVVCHVPALRVTVPVPGPEKEEKSYENPEIWPPRVTGSVNIVEVVSVVPELKLGIIAVRVLPEMLVPAPAIPNPEKLAAPKLTIELASQVAAKAAKRPQRRMFLVKMCTFFDYKG